MEENNTNKKGYQLVSGEKQEEFDNVQLRVTAERKGMGEGI